MRVVIDFGKSAQENADYYYQKAKRLERKRKGAEKAIADLEARYAKLDKDIELPKRKVVKRREQRWYERFHWFYTSDGAVVIGGRDAHQNEQINSKYFGDNDLFFHADIHGASVTILIDGVRSPDSSKAEAAEFAACYSSAWSSMMKTVDVYSLKRQQISKSTDEGSLGTGSFLMKGEREWYRNLKMELIMFVEEDVLNTVPTSTFNAKKFRGRHVLVAQGDIKKSDAAKKVSKFIGYDDIDGVMRQLPPGTFSVDFSD